MVHLKLVKNNTDWTLHILLFLLCEIMHVRLLIVTIVYQLYYWFNAAGIYINNEIVMPLSTIPVLGESKEDITEQDALGFQILVADSGQDPSYLYTFTDLHFIDCVRHNKFLNEEVPKLLNLDHNIGQIFCCTHTNLGFCRCMNISIFIIQGWARIAFKGLLKPVRSL